MGFALPLCPLAGLWGLPGNRLPPLDQGPATAASRRLGPPSKLGRRGLPARRRAPFHGVSSLPAHAAARAHSPGFASPGARANGAGAPNTPLLPRPSRPESRALVGFPSERSPSGKPGTPLRAPLACLPLAAGLRDRSPAWTRASASRLSPSRKSVASAVRPEPDGGARGSLGLWFPPEGFPPSSRQTAGPGGPRFFLSWTSAHRPKASHPVLQSFDRRGESSERPEAPDTPYEVRAHGDAPRSGAAGAGLGSFRTLEASLPDRLDSRQITPRPHRPRSGLRLPPQRLSSPEIADQFKRGSEHPRAPGACVLVHRPFPPKSTRSRAAFPPCMHSLFHTPSFEPRTRSPTWAYGAGYPARILARDAQSVAGQDRA